MKRLFVLAACVLVLAAGCHVAGLKASYEGDDERASVEIEEGRLERAPDPAESTE